MLNKIFYFLSLTILSNNISFAQQVTTSKLIVTPPFSKPSNDSLNVIDHSLFKEDFSVFRNALQRIHPSMYRFKDYKIINDLFDSCYSTLNHYTTETRFFSIIKFLLSSVEDGHFYCEPSPAFRRYYDKNVKVFPLELKFIKDNAYIICGNKESLQPGIQILSINNVTINNIRKELFRYIVSDGAIQTKKYWILSNNFWFYYIIVYGQQSVFNILYKAKDQKINLTTLNADLKKNNNCSPNKVIQEKYLRLTYKTKKIALLTIKTFIKDDLSKSKEDFTRFLQLTFKELKNNQINKLIIDLRGNGGGKDDYGSLLYSYLTNKEFNYYRSLEISTQKLTKETHSNLQIQRPSENNFKGTVFFLIDGLSFSTTAEFCAIAKSNNRGKFFGEETGGGYYGNTSGNSIDTLLPNTKITISIPTTKYVMAVKSDKYKDRGIIPDYEIIPTINEFIKNEDVQLNYALKIMTKK